MIFIVLLACNTKEENASVNTATIDLLTKSEQPKINNEDYNLIWDSYKSLDLKYSLEQLDNTKGLSNSSINTIFQDSENLLWIGTWDGLNRYDGNSFEIFRPELNNKNSLSNQVILKIDEDNTGRIWILTIHGINRYDKKTGIFEHYNFSRENIPPLSESEFNMALDSSKKCILRYKRLGNWLF